MRHDRGRRRESAGDLLLAGRCQRASAACPAARNPRYLTVAPITVLHTHASRFEVVPGLVEL